MEYVQIRCLNSLSEDSEALEGWAHGAQGQASWSLGGGGYGGAHLGSSKTAESNVGTRRRSCRASKARRRYLKRGLHGGRLVRSAGPANNDGVTGNAGTPENRPVFPFQDAV